MLISMSKTRSSQYTNHRLKSVFLALAIALVGALSAAVQDWRSNEAPPQTLGVVTQQQVASSQEALVALESLQVKGRAPKTGYDRDLFSNGWGSVVGCSVRELILQRDLTNTVINEDGCRVMTGTLQDPYSTTTIAFVRGAQTSQAVQIDHVVAVSDAWQKGAQQLTPELRYQFYNDPLNLLAVDGPTNNKKGDGDAATWLPPNKEYRCRYVARQVAVKVKYSLWMTAAEKSASQSVLVTCKNQEMQ